MSLYVKVEYPEMQKFQEQEWYDDECYEHESGMVTFVPEHLWMQVMYPEPELPDEYINNYTKEFSEVKKGQKILIKLFDNDKLIETEALTSANIYSRMPVLLPKPFLEGLNCDIIAVEKENI